MKKIIKLLPSLAAVIPVITMPLVNAKVNIKKAESNLSISVPFGIDGWFTCKLIEGSEAHPEWGSYASITKISISRDEEEFQVPAEISHNGVNYKIRTIDTANQLYGNYTLRLLDLSKAIYLSEICDNAFDRGKGHIPHRSEIGIRWVNFAGANSLKRIGKSAFYDQDFDNKDNDYDSIFNFTQTKVESIGDSAFRGATNQYCNKFKSIIFPDTLKTIGPNAFDKSNVEAGRPLFDQIIFTNGDPDENTFANDTSMPRLADPSKNTSFVICPNWSKDKYKKLNNFNPDYLNMLQVSKIYFEDDTYRNHDLLGIAGEQFVESTLKWVPYTYDTYKPFEGKVIVSITDSHNGRISLNKDGCIQWSNTLEPGDYVFRVQAYCENLTAEKPAVGYYESEITTLHITDKELVTGGSKFLSAACNVAGKDNKLWSVLEDEYTIARTNCSIIDCPEALKNSISIEKEYGTSSGARIYWKSDIPIGSYSFIFQTKIEYREIRNIVTNQQHITLNVYQNDYGINLYLNDDTEAYIGQDIVIDSTQQVLYGFVKGETAATLSLDKLKLSNNKFKLEIVDDTNKKFKITFDPTEFADNQRDEFYVSYEFTTSSGTTLLAYSQVITVVKGTKAKNFNSIPTNVSLNKEKATTETFQVLNLTDTRSILADGTKITLAPWEDAKLASHVTIKPTSDGKSVEVTFDEEYVTFESAHSSHDINLIMNIQDGELTYFYSVSITTFIFSRGGFKYDGEQTLYSYPVKEKKQFKDPFTFTINGKVPEKEKLQNVEYSFYVENDDDKYHKYFDIALTDPQAQDKRTLSLCLTDQAIEDETTREGLTVRITGLDNDNIVYSTTTVNVVIGNILKLDAPDRISIVNGTAGQSDIINTYWNDELEQYPTYTITTLPEGITFEADHFVWTDKVTPGIYYVDISVSKTASGGYVHTQTKTITLDVQEQQSSTNVAAIVGGTVGGVVAAAGISTGIALGVKHNKAKKPSGKKTKK